MVGRESELEQLQRHLEIASGGRRQFVFVSGEPGIGKTTLLNAFTSSLPNYDGFVVARGQCVEQYGAAYMPFFDVLEQLCHPRQGDARLQLLRNYAPSWLLHLPGMLNTEERLELERQSIGITPERRLREITAFLEAVAADRTLVLVLEDLHWLDPSSLSLISFLARRQEPTRMTLIGSYREGEVERLNEPLKNTKEDLELHNYCKHLPLKPLSRSAVREYIEARLEVPRVSEKVVATVYQRSEGNPLFMVNVTDYLIAREAIVQESESVELRHEVELETPSTLAHLIVRQLENLSLEDQELLESASVAGMNFPPSLCRVRSSRTSETS